MRTTDSNRTKRHNNIRSSVEKGGHSRKRKIKQGNKFKQGMHTHTNRGTLLVDEIPFLKYPVFLFLSSFLFAVCIISSCAQLSEDVVEEIFFQAGFVC